jgi:hypothetical protein
MTAKPIFAVGIPRSAGLMEIDRIQERLSEQLTDYHVLLYTHYSHETVFNAFYEKDFNEVKFEELKQIIKDAASPKTD